MNYFDKYQGTQRKRRESQSEAEFNTDIRDFTHFKSQVCNPTAKQGISFFLSVCPQISGELRTDLSSLIIRKIDTQRRDKR